LVVGCSLDGENEGDIEGFCDGTEVVGSGEGFLVGSDVVGENDGAFDG
jgi:hypothetical protein